MEFHSIALVFNDESKAKKFIIAWSHIERELDNRFVFKIDNDESKKKKIILCVAFNGADDASKWKISSRGEKMLDELNKYVNIENISQEYRRFNYQLPKEDELPKDNERSYFSYASRKL